LPGKALYKHPLFVDTHELIGYNTPMSESIGKILKEARAQKGLTIEQVAQLTKIKIRYLEALENDHFDQFPSQAQTRGFLRMYANQVGIPLQPLIDILTGKADEPQVITQKPVAPPTTAVKKRFDLSSVNKLSDLLKLRPNAPAPPVSEAPADDLPPVVTTPLSLEIFREIGSLLKSRRETLGLSLLDIEEFIHVKSFYLKLIEEGDLQALPSMVQAKGMLNNYLNFLDLDSDKIMLRYVDGLQALYFEKNGKAIENKKNNKSSKEKQNKPASTGWKRLLTTDLIFGASVILLILVFSVWGVIQITSMPEQQNKPEAGSISSVLIDEAPLPTTTGTPGNAIKMNPDGSQSQNIDSQPVDAQPTSTLVFTGNGPLQIYLVSHQRAWLRVVVDGKKVFEGRVLPGNAYPYSGNQQIELTTGNAGAIDLSYLQNGEQNDMGLLGNIGEVKSLIFTNQGIFTPTPRFTATATATNQPTLTLQPSATPVPPTVTPYVP
jgi:cytoskeleton protein RodZ